MSEFRTFSLMAALVALFMAAGLVVAGRGGMLIAMLFALALNGWAYWNSDRMVLRMHDAQEVGPGHMLYEIVAPLARRAQLPMPRVYIVDQPQPNAFATGRNPAHAAVAATAGLLQLLNREEIEAVMAHELGHIRNRDTLLMTMTATFAGAISMLGSYFFLFGGRRGGQGNALLSFAAVLLAPFAAMLLQMALSRTREYGADKASAEISGRPRELANALLKLQRGAARIPNPVAARNPAAAALYIVGQGKTGVRDHLFSTHPAMENRVAALADMVERAPAPPSPSIARPGALGLGHAGRERKAGSTQSAQSPGRKTNPWL